LDVIYSTEYPKPGKLFPVSHLRKFSYWFGCPNI